jgi:hypothetical protein
MRLSPAIPARLALAVRIEQFILKFFARELDRPGLPTRESRE